MKRLVLLSLLALLVPLTSTSQEVWPSSEAWPADDAEWYFSHPYVGVNGLILTHRQVDGTVELDGVQWTVLRDTVYSPYWSPDSYEYLVHFNGDTVFWRYNDNVYPLLCFNLEVGDTWSPLPPEHPSSLSGCTPTQMKVSAKTTVTYNGENYRQISIESVVPQPMDWDEPWPSIFWSGTFDERVFATGGHFFPQYNICEAVVDWLYYDERCYSDSELSLVFHGDPSCDYPLFVSVDEIELEQKNLLFPNPVRVGQAVTLSNIQDAKTIILYSVAGQYVEQQSLDNGGSTVQLSVKPGHYIVQIERNNGEMVWQRLVVSP